MFLLILGPRAGEYLTHVVSTESTGKAMADMTHDVLTEYKSVDTLEALVQDNTGSNTGCEQGMHVLLEGRLGRKVHLLGCALHANELPLRAMITKLDGKSSSGNTLTGDLGSQLHKDLRQYEVQNFKAVPCSLPDMPEDVAKDLSQDQLLLRQYMEAVSVGKLEFKLANKTIGPMCLARWLTLAVRILSFYCREKKPTDVLCCLVDYIQNIYGFYWFTIKACSSWLEGPKILFNMIKSIESFSKRWPKFKIFSEDFILKTIQRNAFCCMPENFLAALVFSEEESDREIGVKAVLTIRSQGEKQLEQRSKHQKLNWTAKTWTGLIDIDEVISKGHSPPCLRNISDSLLEDQVRSGQLEPPLYPIHSQSVERAVKLTSEFSKKSYKLSDQRKYIISALTSRKMRPRFNNKCQYEVCDLGIEF